MNETIVTNYPETVNTFDRFKKSVLDKVKAAGLKLDPEKVKFWIEYDNGNKLCALAYGIKFVSNSQTLSIQVTANGHKFII